MSKYKGFTDYERDEEMETETGVEVDFGSGMFIRVLRAGGSNGKFGRVYSRLTKPYRRMMDANTIPKDTEDRLYAELYAEAVIIGWRGMVDVDTGEEIPFNKKEVVDFLLAVPEAFAVIRLRAEAIDSFRKEDAKEDAEKLGNS